MEGHCSLFAQYITLSFTSNYSFIYIFIKTEESASERSGHVVKQGVSQDEEDFEANLDPKVRKGLERIRKLDAILADKLKVCLLCSCLLFALIQKKEHDNLERKSHSLSASSSILFSKLPLDPKL